MFLSDPRQFRTKRCQLRVVPRLYIKLLLPHHLQSSRINEDCRELYNFLGPYYIRTPHTGSFKVDNNKKTVLLSYLPHLARF